MASVVYFNQWFSSITAVIEDIKKKYGENIYIIASSKNENHVYKTAVDKFIVEDWESAAETSVSMKNYVDYVLNLCKENKVDIFFVRKNSKYVAQRRDEFEALGVKVLTEDFDTLELIDKKHKVYEHLINEGMEEIIPKFFNTTDMDEDTARDKIEDVALNSGKNGNPKWCLKLASDEGGCSFRVIDAEPNISMDSLRAFRINRLSGNEVLSLINGASKKSWDRLMFMEVLKSPEISVDCYNSSKGFVAICRSKIEGRFQKLYFNEQLYNYCKTICNIFGLKNPFNVQFRVVDGGSPDEVSDLRLLEINARMAGGTYYAALFDMNICELCLKDQLGTITEADVAKYINFDTKYVTHVERAIKL